MHIKLKQLPDSVKGPERLHCLTSEAVEDLLKVEEVTSGLIYKSFWRDSTSTFMAKRLHHSSYSPGYDPHNYGLSVTLDLEAIKAKHGKSTYSYIVDAMKNYNWFCHRPDKVETGIDSNIFHYLGKKNDTYWPLATKDPVSWKKPIEQKIYDIYGKDFSLSIGQAQSALVKLGLMHGQVDGRTDLYFRESMLAFQRTWDLTLSGSLSITTSRILAFLTAEIELEH